MESYGCASICTYCPIQSSEILFPCDSFDLSIASIYSYILVLCLEFDVLQKEDGTGGWEEESHPY